MTFRFYHNSLSSTLRGVDLGCAAHFRGIRYGTIPRRFANPEPFVDYPAELDCTIYGPRCPQTHVDVTYLLRTPPSISIDAEPEDEFGCLNLDVMVPKMTLTEGRRLPVVVWIHGGSQAVTFGSAASRVCDPSAIMNDAVRSEKPLIFVSVQYRLNIFAFGGESNEKNLALKDQLLALKWVQHHISAFNGDPENVTLAGESAGAVYCHALLVMKAPAKQAILSSGSLYLSPPQPAERASLLRDNVKRQLKELGGFNLGSASAQLLVDAVTRTGIQSWFLQTEPSLNRWWEDTGISEAVLLSHVQNESVIWRNGILSADIDSIINAFNLAEDDSDELKDMYQIYPNRPSAATTGALDFINDYRFVLPVKKMARLWQDQGKLAFRGLIDEVNPWQPSSGAHHAVDLLLLFGGFDMSASPDAEQVGEKMRERWIKFINGEDPWPSESSGVFGPYGRFQELDDIQIRSRRRVSHVMKLDGMDSTRLDRVFSALAAGRVSLSN
ncbi:Alpha/Beta hydrolase protein [Dactylonectria estremocensis]|uniref:Alpha/Beta hydrolase protein n=1 Tax=Dactylonectria estremocensis TaxID=1079267 RepID=A0A9P9DGJ1_9HYPO|nr:Alpha/Beta hydrolase protein [Dactylonectria estremocensis]